MKAISIILSLAALTSTIAADSDPLAARLFWRNGESLAGRPLGADAAHLTWDSSVVEEPIVLDRSRLLFMDFNPPKAPKSIGTTWSLLLRNGDCVHGDSVRVVDGTLEIDCPRHGHLSVPLKEVRSLRRLRGGDLVYAGPSGQTGWTGAGFTTDGGALATRKWDETLQMPMEMPDRLALDIVLRSTKLLNFKLMLQSSSGVTPTIETWGADVVLAAPLGCTTYGLFAPLLKLKGDEKGLALRMYWDQTAQRMQVFDMDGKELGKLEWTMKGTASTDKKRGETGEAAPAAGVSVKNRGANWVIDELCVRRWDGKLPKAAPDTLPRAELANGTWKSGAEVKDLDLQSVQSVVWSAEAPPLQPSVPRPAAAFVDGTMISGPLQDFDDKGFTMQPPWSAKPVKSDLAGLLRLVFETPEKLPEEPPLPRQDKLRSGPVNIHGTIVCNGGAEPRWRFVGGHDALALKLPEKREDLELTWARPAEEIKREAPQAILMANDGSMLRAGFQAIDETGVTFDCPWTTGHSVPHQRMQAIRLGGMMGGIKGFRDPGWAVFKGSEKLVEVQRAEKPEKDVLKLEPGVVYGHPGLARGDEIRFSFAPLERNYGGLQIELFAGDVEEGRRPLKISLWRSSNQFYAMTGDTNRGVRSEQMLRNLGEGAINIKILFRDGKVQLLANDTTLLSEAVKPEQRAQTGLMFSCGSVWNNQLNPVKISDFVVVEQPGALNPLQVSPEAKQQALSVPRFRREQFPLHALLASNGDLVRGQVDAATDKLVRFTSGLETHDLPAERLQAILWLTKPESKDKKNDAASPPAAAPSLATHWLMLDDQSRLPLQVQAFTEASVVGNSALLGAFNVPTARLAALRWAPPAASVAVDSYTKWRLEEAPEPVIPQASEEASKLLGKAAPDFMLPMMDKGTEFQLSKLRGQVVVIDFWATWCGPCVASMPGLMDVMQAFKGKPVTFITLNQGESAEQVKKFIERRKWDLPVAMDGSGAIAGKYSVDGIPHTVLVGKDGKVEWTHTGFSAEGAAKLTEAINKALSPPPQK